MQLVVLMVQNIDPYLLPQLLFDQNTNQGYLNFEGGREDGDEQYNTNKCMKNIQIIF